MDFFASCLVKLLYPGVLKQRYSVYIMEIFMHFDFDMYRLFDFLYKRNYICIDI